MKQKNVKTGESTLLSSIFNKLIAGCILIPNGYLAKFMTIYLIEFSGYLLPALSDFIQDELDQISSRMIDSTYNMADALKLTIINSTFLCFLAGIIYFIIHI